MEFKQISYSQITRRKGCGEFNLAVFAAHLRRFKALDMQAAVLKFRQVLNSKSAPLCHAVLAKFNRAAQSSRARDDLILQS